MNVDYRVKKTLELFNEMNKFIAKKGGTTFTWDDCDKMTLSEFLMLLAPNVNSDECFNVKTDKCCDEYFNG